MEGKRRAEVVVGAGRDGEAEVAIAKGAGAGIRVVKERGAGAVRGDAAGAGRGDAAVLGAGSVEGASELPCMYTFCQLGLKFFALFKRIKINLLLCAPQSIFVHKNLLKALSQKSVFLILVLKCFVFLALSELGT